MQVTVVINKAGGSVNSKGITESMLKELFDAENIQAEIYIEDCRDIKEIVKKSIEQKVDMIIAGGGDGTISTVASLMVASDIPLGVLPLGTLNHFAKDIGMPPELDKCIKIFAEKNITNVDVGEVNGEIFINNSSIGLYPQIVKYRDKEQERLGLSKWPSMMIAIIKSLIYFPRFEISLYLNDKDKTNKEFKLKTPFVFLGNNQYTMSAFSPGKRDSISDGKLSLYTFTHTGRLGLAKLLLMFVFNRLKQEKYFTSLLVESVTIKSKKKRLSVSHDGEVSYMRSPLNYKSLAGKLKIVCPVVQKSDYDLKLESKSIKKQ